MDARLQLLVEFLDDLKKELTEDDFQSALRFITRECKKRMTVKRGNFFSRIFGK